MAERIRTTVPPVSEQETHFSLWMSLRHPCTQLRAFDAMRPSYANVPYATWTGLVGIAVGGSAVYGASLSRVLPRWRPAESALWLALSAGAGWCVFGPALVLVSRRHAFTCAHACLVTMAYGEAVLLAGAAINVLLAARRSADGLDPGAFNLAWVGLSNVVMAAMLTLQLRAIGVPTWTTLLLWMALLNGSGGLFFWWFRRLLRGAT